MAARLLSVSSPGRRTSANKSLELGKTRQSKGLSLEEIADQTKISMRFLRAIEDEDFDQLPGGIFNTSYLRQYADAIGFEEARLLAHYRRKAGCEDHAEPVERPRGGFLRWLTARS